MLEKEDFHVIIDAIEAQRIAGMFGDDPKFIPHPATWLHQERWADEIVHKRRPTFRNGAAELLAREFEAGQFPVIDGEAQARIGGD